jgi:Domain of unknown function (DUF4157)
MRAFAQKENRPKERIPSGPARSNTATPAPVPVPYRQRTIGKQAVQRLPRTKDKEPEADPTGTAATTCSARDFSQAQTCAETPLRIQPKLTVNTPGDIDEQEADRAAEQVMQVPESRQQLHCPCGGGCPQCQGARSDYEHLQIKGVRGNDAGGTEAPPVIHEVLNSPGQPLDSATRAFMEPRFGQDFGRVRVHTGGRASESAEAVKALAYTVGHDIVFRADQYTPETATGRRLLAHELAHVVQQRAASAAPAVAPGVASTRQRLQRQTPPPPVPPVRQAGANEEFPTVQGILDQLRRNITQAEEALRNPGLTGSARNRLVEVLSWARNAEAELRRRGVTSGATSGAPVAGVGALAIPRPISTVSTVATGGFWAGAATVAGMLFSLTFLTSGFHPEDLAAQAYARAEAANNALRTYLRGLPPDAAIPLSRPAIPSTNVPVPQTAPPVAAVPQGITAPMTASPAIPLVRPVPGSRTATRARPRSRPCRPPPYLGEAVALLASLGTADLAEDARRFLLFRGPPRTLAEVRVERENFVSQVGMETKHAVLLAFTCDGRVLAFAVGNKHVYGRRFADVRHAEEDAEPTLRALLNSRPLEARRFGSLVSICESPPCDGNRPPHNCENLLHRIVRDLLPGGQALFISAGWPSGHRENARRAYDEEWSRLRGRQMPSNWRD